MAKRYRVISRRQDGSEGAISYPTNPRASRENWEMKRAGFGDVVDDIPAKSVPWLLREGHIEPVEEAE